MKFLNNWTISLDKLPAYSCFNKKFKITLDYDLMKKMYKTEAVDEYNKGNRKKMLKNILDEMKDDILEISYYHPCSLGRFYPTNSISPICISRHMKHTLFHSLAWVDLDMIAGHSTILYEIAKHNKIEVQFQNVKKYIDNKPAILKELHEYYYSEGSSLTEDNVKDIFNIGIYGGGHNTWLKQMEEEEIALRTNVPHPTVVEFLKECKSFMELIYLNNPAIVDKVKGSLDMEKDLYSIKSRVMSYWCGTIENHIIYLVYKLLIKRDAIFRNNIVLEYDGVCLRLRDMDSESMDQLLCDINDMILKETKLNVKMKWKGYRDEHIHLDELDATDDTTSESSENSNITFSDDEDEVSQLEDTFTHVKTEFEKTHLKIVNKAFFVKEFENRVITLNKEKIMTAYEHLQYSELKWNAHSKSYDTVKKQFISEWFKSSDIKRKDDVGVFPTGKVCPENYYNMWKPFDMELVTEWEPKPDAVAIIRRHILILCGNDASVYDYFEKWIAQMIQFPAVKSICPILISKEGAGKGTLLQLFTKMMGSTKVFETTQPSRDVWGEFNGLMADAFLVNLNELSKKETMESEGRIKGLITDSTLKINNKGIAQFPIESFHRFIVTTNQENPMTTTQDDRRKAIIRSSDEKCGDKEYFNGLYQLLNDKDVIKSCYEYFKSIPNMDKFNELQMPVTEYHKDLKQLSTSPVESFLKDFVLENYYAKEPIKLYGKEIFVLFNSWLKKCGLEYGCNLPAFGLRLKNLKINGITKGAHSKQGEANLFDIPTMIKHFKLDAIVYDKDEEVEEEKE